MGIGTTPQLAPDVAFEDQVIRKAFRHLMSFVFILMIIAYLDRINIGFAALSMNKELKLTAAMFGFANTVFYAGYVLCEIPSNMMLARFGARKWIARILITWGLASSACMFAAGAHSLYALRLIVGIAEAGFMPGIFLYLTYWFPPTHRARATSLFLFAQPATIALGAFLSGFILDHAHGFEGISGWRWLFLIEGFPAFLLGFVALFYLSDGPATARWLTEDEKSALQRRLQREQRPQPGHGKVWREVLSRNIILLALIYFGIIAGLNTLTTWTPQIVREVLRPHSFSFVGLMTAIPSICAVMVMPFWGSSSDRNMERTWHIVLPMVLAAFGWVMVAVVKMPEVRMLGLIFSSVGNFAAQVVFWTVVAHIPSPRARPVGIAFVSSCGVCSASLSPLLVGWLRDLTHSWAASLLFVAAMVLGSAALVFLIPAEEKVPPAALAS